MCVAVVAKLIDMETLLVLRRDWQSLEWTLEMRVMCDL
jgi:hypothetical protein